MGTKNAYQQIAQAALAKKLRSSGNLSNERKLDAAKTRLADIGNSAEDAWQALDYCFNHVADELVRSVKTFSVSNQNSTQEP